MTGASGGARGEPVAALAIPASAAFTEHAAALRAFLMRRTRDADAADDLLQETFVRLLVETAAGRRPVRVRPWLFRVAANLAATRARRLGIASRRAADLVRRDVAPSPEEVLLDREAARTLGYRIAHLPPDVRTAMLLSAHGYSGAEIAAHIGRSELATRSLLSRHRGRLRSAPEAA